MALEVRWCSTEQPFTKTPQARPRSSGVCLNAFQEVEETDHNLEKLTSAPTGSPTTASPTASPTTTAPTLSPTVSLPSVEVEFPGSLATLTPSDASILCSGKIRLVLAVSVGLGPSDIKSCILSATPILVTVSLSPTTSPTDVNGIATALTTAKPIVTLPSGRYTATAATGGLTAAGTPSDIAAWQPVSPMACPDPIGATRERCIAASCATGCTGPECGVGCIGANCADGCCGADCGNDCTGANCADACHGFKCGADCTGAACAEECEIDDCGVSCIGATCAHACQGDYCGNGCTGANCADACHGLKCGASCTGAACAEGCHGPECGSGCDGARCAAGCTGFRCAAGCIGADCAAGCTGPECAGDCLTAECADSCRESSHAVGRGTCGCVGNECPSYVNPAV
eukprot:m.364957 g.364957  ORF g.364957 m.364957 type:complete len:402 (-) comp28080_c0_seq36:78-1283(-)